MLKNGPVLALNLLKVEENKLYEDKKIEYICGIDEAGRGPLAGPVVVGAVIMPKDSFIEGVNDSKKISEKKREKIYEQKKMYFNLRHSGSFCSFLTYRSCV